MENFNLLKNKLFFISNTANENERTQVFKGSDADYKFWQDIFLKDKKIATLGAINCVADDFTDREKLRASNATNKIIQLVVEAVKKGFSIFVLGASTKYMIKRLKRMFPDCIFLGGNELTAVAILQQEKHFLNPKKNVLILGGTTSLAQLNAELLKNFMPVDKIRPSARGDETELVKKFINTPFNPVSFEEINNGFRTTQLLNSIHYKLLEKENFKNLRIKLCLEVARPTVYKDVCKKLAIKWVQLGIFEHPELTWEKPLYDTKQHGLFACFLAGYIFQKYNRTNPVEALQLACQEGFKLQHIK